MKDVANHTMPDLALSNSARLQPTNTILYGSSDFTHLTGPLKPQELFFFFFWDIYSKRTGFSVGSPGTAHACPRIRDGQPGRVLGRITGVEGPYKLLAVVFG